MSRRSRSNATHAGRPRSHATLSRGIFRPRSACSMPRRGVSSLLNARTNSMENFSTSSLDQPFTYLV